MGQLLTVSKRDHGGGVDVAAARFGGARIDWIDLSTGINPVPFPIPALSQECWTSLPDTAAVAHLLKSAREFWDVPASVDILCAPGASAIISRIPGLCAPATVAIPGPTYNEHAAAFATAGWQVVEQAPADAQVVVHPNNPDGRLWHKDDLPVQNPGLTIIDESFCDVCPEKSLIYRASEPGTLVLKSFGKFWGLAGLRLGFAIGEPPLIADLKEALGPWPVAGPALEIGAAALSDHQWARKTRRRLAEDCARLDSLMQRAGAETLGGTTLFRLYRVDSAENWQDRLAEHQIWSRVFPYNRTWLRLGLPHPDHWARLEAAMA